MKFNSDKKVVASAFSSGRHVYIIKEGHSRESTRTSWNNQIIWTPYKEKIKFNQYIINSLVPKAGVCQQVHYHVSGNARSVNTCKTILSEPDICSKSLAQIVYVWSTINKFHVWYQTSTNWPPFFDVVHCATFLFTYNIDDNRFESTQYKLGHFAS